jgi:hypothetical protein
MSSLNQADHEPAPEQLTPDFNRMWSNAEENAKALADAKANGVENPELMGGRAASRRRSYKKRRHAKRKSRKSRKSRS